MSKHDYDNDDKFDGLDDILVLCAFGAVFAFVGMGIILWLEV